MAFSARMEFTFLINITKYRNKQNLVKYTDFY